jgi:hypothetical protein
LVNGHAVSSALHGHEQEYYSADFLFMVCLSAQGIHPVEIHKIMTKVRKSAMVGDMQVLAAGDMCAICQEKMHAPISLRCKHVFCEDCVSEWYAI